MSMGKIVLLVLIAIAVFMGAVYHISNQAGTPMLTTSRISKDNDKPEKYSEERVYVEYKGNTERNPFMSPLDAKPNPSNRPTPRIETDLPALDKIKLQGIIVIPSGSKAVINDQILTVGESIDGVKLLNIGKDYVILRYGGRRVKKTLE